ncbi:hypothetical protein K470DRAFT_250840 [Piedraia hortae CBS 480.64]|uniref:DNA repair and recombination protein RAD26 n=1 Tax=Piedraia hortae CBS 480.64 TaxID=1314780 RepID=A0A6A7BUN1_9PEZI|nr:hypothetical protein K470DRAFT_250840 [Piedraia hortae CBS 480.64]
MKPFRPPSLIKREIPSANEPPQKRRRISDNDVSQASHPSKGLSNPLLPVQPNVAQHPVKEKASLSGTPQLHYTVLWRKVTTKKNKTWDGDGTLSVVDGTASLIDDSGKQLGRTSCNGPLLVGSKLSVSGKEVEIVSMTTKEATGNGQTSLTGAKQPSSLMEPLQETYELPTKGQTVDAFGKRAMTTKSSQAPFKKPTMANATVVPKRNPSIPTPRHDPNAEGALVMRRPKAPKGKQVVDVVVDPLLSKHLRDHQRTGVSFLYECVMGMRGYSGEGAILADEMGLGKTLQTIALLWTLLKQNPIHGDGPVIRKALIVCPVSLNTNWRKEFAKWLGKDRIGVFVAEDKKVRLKDFTHGKAYNVMIIGYEKLRLVQTELQKGTGIDIVIADEGHRLKTAQNKAALAIKSLNTDRRIILSGTPIQNDLAEFYTMVDFVNPGSLGKYQAFKKEFEMPILRSRQPGAGADEVESGQAKSSELAAITNMFILRRTAAILCKYLPLKTEHVVLCRPTKTQASVYNAIVKSPAFTSALGSPAVALDLINVLKKVCNCPSLLMRKGVQENSSKQEFLQNVPPSMLKSRGASGKLQVLDSLLHSIRISTHEKVVLVSNYTSTMDIIATLLSALDYSFLRLDGSTPAAKRQELVDRFNRSSPEDAFVFLLSAKAGGFGLNLIGASRLILYDLDWNPATDIQAMARIHRDGQKRPCYIYRLVMQGGLDEKIFQRQVNKTGLADSIVDGKSAVSGFTREELRDLFTLDESGECQTHKLLQCKCGGSGTPVNVDGLPERNDVTALCTDSKGQTNTSWLKASQVDMGAQEARKPKQEQVLSLMQYLHFDTSLVPQLMSDDMDPLESVIDDDVLRSVLREDGNRVGFVFTKNWS